MIRTKKAPKPTLDQSKWLRRIAQSWMVKVYAGPDRDRYFILASNGDKIPTPIAEALIHNGWVKGQRDGMFNETQTYVALKPDVQNDGRATHLPYQGDRSRSA